MLFRAAVALLLAMPAARAESTLVECIADGWYAAAGGLEGSGQTLRLGGSDVILLAFRMAAVEGWKVEKAAIVLHLAEPSEPGEITVSPAGGPWNEASRNPPPLREGASAAAKGKPNGWISIPVPVELAQAVADGKAPGFALRSAGSTRVFHSRETIQFAPFLAIAGRRPSK